MASTQQYGDANQEHQHGSNIQQNPSTSLGWRHEKDRETDSRPNAPNPPQSSTEQEFDPIEPLTWPRRQKWVITVIISCFTLIPPVSSTMLAPALTQMSADLGIKEPVVSQLTLTIFMLAYAIGPLLFGPLSETIGRSPVLLVANVFFLLWTLACGLSRTVPEMIAFRLLAGIGGSAPLAVGGGVIRKSDLWAAEERGQAVGIYSLAPLLGPVIGPLTGGWITERTTWRWMFYSTSIAAGVAGVIGLVFLRETYTPVLRRQKQPRETVPSGGTSESLTKRLRLAFTRPLQFFITEPIILVVAIYMACVFGILYIILSTFPKVWAEVYGESPGIGGLNYLSLGIGYVLGSQANTHASDAIYRRLQKRKSLNNNDDNLEGEPEFRVPTMFVGSVLIPVGIFWYGWSVQARTHWIMPNIGSFIFSLGSVTCMQSMQAYVIDSYARYAASGLAAAVLLRNIAAFGIPLFAPYMYDALHYGWGNSVLGFAGVVIGIPSPFLFWKFGKKIRGRSRFAPQ
ncbi:major facilitator superfamily domain-containing protein [Aspergillus avenaceus]|uniref:Major facilitator superfamily domain-containing protein n=1 Tax=Aspergillus avenaceus TaxID=36643 RepID=A0A5N6U6H7_ASPAV|nr:major facilitator superfamily domain-containing protein [Aspergillus avenaceus]